MQRTASLRATFGWLPNSGLRPRLMMVGAFAAVMIAAAMAWQWSWLVAIGAAPLFLSVAPCVAMCGLGLCMHRMGGRSCSTATAAAPRTQDDPGRIGMSPDRTMNSGDVT